LNAFAERFVGSAKSECLDRMVLLGESHLQAAVREYVRHYHEERPHQGLKNEVIAPQTVVSGTGHVKCRERLGGLLKFYYREAAQAPRRRFRTPREQIRWLVNERSYPDPIVRLSELW
jgi:putative transposase